MFTKLTHALHHLFNPHCSICESLRERENDARREHELELRVCQSCETLKTQLEFQNQLIRELTKSQVEIEEIKSNNFQPIMPKHKPWSVRRAELEKADRELARKLRDNKEREITADNLDEELESLENSNA